MQIFIEKKGKKSHGERKRKKDAQDLRFEISAIGSHIPLKKNNTIARRACFARSTFYQGKMQENLLTKAKDKREFIHDFRVEQAQTLCAAQQDGINKFSCISKCWLKSTLILIHSLTQTQKQASDQIRMAEGKKIEVEHTNCCLPKCNMYSIGLIFSKSTENAQKMCKTTKKNPKHNE